MRGFSEWLNLNESFKLPFKVIEDIYNHTKKVYTDRINNPKADKFYAEEFDLDFSGTNYEFLNKYNPRVNVNYKVLPSDINAYYDGMNTRKEFDTSLDPWNTSTFKIKTVGYITIGLSNIWMEISQTIEHEVFHFVHALIKKHQIDTSYKNKKKKNVEPLHGGLPKTHIVKRIMHNNGFDVYGRKDKMMTKHHFRPMEYLPNLDSLTHAIKTWYLQEKYLNRVTDLEKASKDIEEKKKYFTRLLKVSGGAADKLADLKTLDIGLY